MENGDQQNQRKRKITDQSHFSSHDDHFLALTLSLPGHTTGAISSPVVAPSPVTVAAPQLIPPPYNPLILPMPPLFPQPSFSHLPPPPPPPPPAEEVSQRQTSRRPRQRRNTSILEQGKSETIPPPYPWATDRRATVQKFTDLISNRIYRISGQVQCKRCEKIYEIEFDLEQKFNEIGEFLTESIASMHDRAPDRWMNPLPLSCRFCEQDNCVKPVLNVKKRSINWLFLLLGEMIGHCTLPQLRYFCKHTQNHRTGAKDRMVYLTYVTLFKQLDPDGPFDI